MMWWLAFWWRGLRYRRQARHLAAEAGPPYGYVPDQDFYGSMTLAGERGWLPAPEVAHSGWWGQTAADLAPEALDEEVMPSVGAAPDGLHVYGLPSGPHVSSGPGDLTSLAPGPDTARLAWLDRQLASHAEWARRMRGQVTGWGLEGAAA